MRLALSVALRLREAVPEGAQGLGRRLAVVLRRVRMEPQVLLSRLAEEVMVPEWRQPKGQGRTVPQPERVPRSGWPAAESV